MNTFSLNVRKYPCRIPNCDKEFNSTQTRGRHEKKHGEPEHVCETCDKKFFRKDHLLQHKIVHKDVSDLKCDFRPKVFKHIGAKQRHEIEHVLPKLKCKNFKFCGYQTKPGRLDHLNEHQSKCFKTNKSEKKKRTQKGYQTMSFRKKRSLKCKLDTTDFESVYADNNVDKRTLKRIKLSPPDKF